MLPLIDGKGVVAWLVVVTRASPGDYCWESMAIRQSGWGDRMTVEFVWERRLYKTLTWQSKPRSGHLQLVKSVKGGNCWELGHRSLLSCDLPMIYGLIRGIYEKESKTDCIDQLG